MANAFISTKQLKNLFSKNLRNLKSLFTKQQKNQTAKQEKTGYDISQHGFAASNLQKKYGNRLVIKDFSFYLNRGEAVALLGPNGAGKTTSFYMLSGLLMPDAGHIFMDGKEITALPVHVRARLGLGYLPQEASIFRGLTVEQNIKAILEINEKNKQTQKQKLNELLTDFSLEHLRKSPAPALSGGERRRLEIARALAANPSYILLDEPLAGVDPIAVKDIQHLIIRLKQRNVGVLITDHNVRETLKLVDRAYVIYDGKLLLEGTADAIINNKQVRDHYLGDDFRM
ncbi:MAG: LPS export ABC transporter ATP-binding protein [Alphaproteobacteria bacterium]|nr:LPS export ABC transporter ATP-binding protein [Alphaproteobacteria bacterium]